jgi:hypothetical protein
MAGRLFSQPLAKNKTRLFPRFCSSGTSKAVFDSQRLEKAAAIYKEMPEQMKEGLCNSLSGEEHPWQACMDKDFGEFEPDDKEAFCAWLKRDCGLDEK